MNRVVGLEARPRRRRVVAPRPESRLLHGSAARGFARRRGRGASARCASWDASGAFAPRRRARARRLGAARAHRATGRQRRGALPPRGAGRRRRLRGGRGRAGNRLRGRARGALTPKWAFLPPTRSRGPALRRGRDRARGRATHRSDRGHEDPSRTSPTLHKARCRNGLGSFACSPATAPRSAGRAAARGRAGLRPRARAARPLGDWWPSPGSAERAIRAGQGGIRPRGLLDPLHNPFAKLP